MSVPPIQMASIHWAAAAAGTLAEPWKPDAIVAGRVLEYLSETQLLLEIDGIKVEAVVRSPDRIPRQFLARIRGSGPTPALELVGPAADGQQVTAALRERLPRQGGLPPLLADLRALARAPDARALPAPVREAVARLEASIADHRDVLDPDVLRDTVRRAGLQLEHALLQFTRASGQASTNPIDYDLKGALQRLVRALQDTLPATHASQPAPPAVTGGSDIQPPLLQLPLQPQSRVPPPQASAASVVAGHMLQSAQGALARIEIMQLQAYPSASPLACMVEIPVRDDDGFDVLQVRINEDAEDSGQAAGAQAANWTLEFTLDLPGLGPVHGRIRLHGTSVGIDLWVRDEAAVQALDEQNGVLPQILRTLGLQLVQLRTRCGTPARRTDVARTLLDTSA